MNKTGTTAALSLLLSAIICVLLFGSMQRRAFSPAENVQPLRVVHVLVALCDNDSQGIVPVPKKIGNGNDPEQNLYWGCGYGVRTFFNNSEDWKLIAKKKNISGNILERCIWKHRRHHVVLVADAYKGARIKTCTVDFLKNASGNYTDTCTAIINGSPELIHIGDAALVCYVGHDGLMDFSLNNPPVQKEQTKKDAMILACASKLYFKDVIKTAGAHPLLWTTNLMAPEAYTLKAAVDGWILKENGEQVRVRAAKAYDQYQHCGYSAAYRLFATGF